MRNLGRPKMLVKMGSYPTHGQAALMQDNSCEHSLSSRKNVRKLLAVVGPPPESALAMTAPQTLVLYRGTGYPVLPLTHKGRRYMFHGYANHLINH